MSKYEVLCVGLAQQTGDNHIDLVHDPWELTDSLTWSYFFLTWVSEEASLEWLHISTLVNYHVSSSKDQCLLTSASLTQNWSRGTLSISRLCLAKKYNFLLKEHTTKTRTANKSLFLQTQRTLQNLALPTNGPALALGTPGALYPAAS